MVNKYKTEILAAASVVLSWMAIGTVVFHHLEKWDWIQSAYFSVVTLTTVGYGDLHPTTDTARLADIFYILFGVAAVVSAVGVIGSNRVRKKTEKYEERSEKK